MKDAPLAFKSLADFKRQLTVGRRVQLTHHQHPERSRETSIHSTGSASFSLAPRNQKEEAANIQWPKSANFEPATGTLFSTGTGPRLRLLSLTLLN